MQGAGYSWQQLDRPVAPLGVSATQESKTSIPQSTAKYKGLDELLGKAKGGRMSSKNAANRIRVKHPICQALLPGKWGACSKEGG